MAKEDLKLRTGRDIHLQSLEQRKTYGVMLEGLPTREKNQLQLESLRERARRLLPGVEPYLVPPRETPIKWPREEKYPFGDPARLPPVTCIAHFRSSSPARDPQLDYSELVVVWLQDEFAFPIDPQVLEHLLALDWERLAGEWEY
jgi:hypothetical protein